MPWIPEWFAGRFYRPFTRDGLFRLRLPVGEDLRAAYEAAAEAAQGEPGDWLEAALVHLGATPDEAERAASHTPRGTYQTRAPWRAVAVGWVAVERERRRA